MALHVECDAEGHGIDPTDPPWVWEALGADGWVRCDVEDRTGGFNTPGDVVVHVPASHVEAVLEERSAGWLRCRIVAADATRPDAVHRHAAAARPSTRRRSAAPSTAVHGEDIVDELVGVSEGVPGQRFALLRRPVVASERPVAGRGRRTGRAGSRGSRCRASARAAPTTSTGGSTPTRARSSSAPPCASTTARCSSTAPIPPAGAHIRVRRYRTGGGRVGNVAAHEIVTLKSAIPFIGRVDNRRPAAGGVDGETLEAAKTRGPLVLGTRNRAVTARDYEQLAREATPRGRPGALPARRRRRAAPTADDGGAAGVRVLDRAGGRRPTRTGGSRSTSSCRRSR